MPFHQGQPKTEGSGRKAGTPNKQTGEIRAVLMQATHEIGGMARLVAWIKESPQNEYAFWTTSFMKLLPVQVEGPGERRESELSVTIKPEELDKRLEERGLPTFIFG